MVQKKDIKRKISWRQCKGRHRERGQVHRDRPSNFCEYHIGYCLTCCHEFHPIGNIYHLWFNSKGERLSEEVQERYNKREYKIWRDKWEKYRREQNEHGEVSDEELERMIESLYGTPIERGKY